MIEQNAYVVAFVDVLTHPAILRRRAAGNVPVEIQIPRASVVVHAEDGDVLTASASGGPTTPGPNMGGFLLESIGNSLGNVIDSDDSLAGDIAGGVAETWVDNQVERADASASRSAARAAGQPTVWSLDAGPVKLTFNNFVPLTNAQAF